MRRTIVTVAATGAAALVLAAPAHAGTNNGTSNWYWSKTCTVSGGNLNVTNYDINGGGDQQYHIDADRAGGTGTTPKVYANGTNTGKWNDFYLNGTSINTVNTFKVVFGNGSSCSVTG